MRARRTQFRETVKANFFIVGAPKCGTTAWHSYLRTHPDIFFSEVKEPSYFASDMPGIRWVSSLRTYEALFRRAHNAKVIGEASAIYLYSAHAAEAIHAYNPDAKILIFLRAQEDFLPSWHHQLLFRFAEDIEDFEKAWRLCGSRSAQDIPKTCLEPKMLDYVAVADFRTQVERYLSKFHRDQILVIYFDDWIKAPRSTYLQIMQFLSLVDDGRTEFPRVNEAKSYRVKWAGRLIARPPRMLRLAINAIKKITGRDALGWGVKATQLISSPGYTTKITPELRQEIKRRYAEDNQRLCKALANGPDARLSF